MKKQRFILTVFMLLAGLSFVACEPNAEPDDVKNTLPEIKDFDVEPSEEGQLTFDAYDAWSISADKSWISFTPASGDKGENVVKYKVKDGYGEASTAIVTLSIGSDKVTFNVTRTESERVFDVLSGRTPVSSLEFSETSKSYTLTVKANFMWDLLSNATTWPGWLVKPSSAVSGVLNEQSGLYEGTVVIALDEAEIPKYYESKTGKISFSDLNDLEYTVDLAVSHTFEKPLEPESVLSNALGTNILTVGLDGKIKETGSNTLEFTVNPGPGESDYRGFPVARITYPPYGEEDLDWAPCAIKDNTSTYGPENWVSMSESGENKYTLTVNRYPEAYELPAGSGRKYFTLKTLIFMLPSSVYDGFSGVGNMDGKNPEMVWWWNLNKFTLVDIYGDTIAPGEVYEQYVKYVITINVEQPEE